MAAAETRTPLRREIELDFIRGVAILMVIDYHSPLGWMFKPFLLLGFTSAQNFGWAGVDLFFVLSGLLVGGLLVKEWKVRGRINSGRFLIRRGLKIWPPYYTLLLLMLITRHRTLHQLWGNLLNIQNYVGGVAFTWSLAVEEHAYLILVLILGLAAKFGMRMRSLFLLLAVLAVSVSVLRLVLTLHGYNTFEATHTRIEGIFYGVMLAILYHYVPDTFRAIQNYRLFWLGVFLAGLAALRFVNQSPLESTLTIDVVNIMAVALIMLLYRHREDRPRRNPVYRFVAWIGLYSYGIYLWHVSMEAPVEAVARHLPHAAAVLWTGIAPAVLAVLVGIFFTKLVEFPTLKLRDRLFPRPVDSAVGVPAEVEAAAGVDGSKAAVLLETKPAE
jgi:peptidoglycan/LPS O-acetylase OafA/YrhL